MPIRKILTSGVRDAFLVCPSLTLCHVSDNYLALNIAHFLERTAAFVVIGMALVSHFKHSLTLSVLGELVFSVVYRATGDRAGFQQ